MRLSSDVVTIMLIYVGPYELRNFFEEHNIEMTLKFRYDARSYKLTVWELEMCFGKFPNIVLVGVNVFGLIGKNVGMINNVISLRIRSLNLDSLHEFPDCFKLENLELCGFGRSFSFRMFNAPNVKKIFFEHCDLDMMNVFGEMCGENIRIIMCNNFYITKNDIECMERLPKLDTLILSDCRKSLDKLDWRLNKLRRLEAKNGSEILNVEKSVIPGCRRLRHLVIETWNENVDLEVLGLED